MNRPLRSDRVYKYANGWPRQVEDAGEIPWGQLGGAVRSAAGVDEELCDKGKVKLV